MNTIASQISGVSVVYTTVVSDADQRIDQSSASLAFVRGIHRSPVNSPHKRPVTRNMFPYDDVIIEETCMIDFFVSQSQPIYNLIARETLHYLVGSKLLYQTDGNFPEWPQKAMLNLRHDYFHHVPCCGNTLSRRHQWKSDVMFEPQPHKDIV